MHESNPKTSISKDGDPSTADSPISATVKRAKPDLQWLVWLAVAVVFLVGILLRLWHLDHDLPGLPNADETAVVSRTDLILHGHLPTQYDWPTGSMVVLAGVLRVLGIFQHSFLVDGSHAQYLTARVLSALAGCALIPTVGLLAYELTPVERRRQTPGILASLTIGLAYTAVRMSRMSHPEIEQALVATVAVWLVVLYVRKKSWWLILLAAAAAGLAGSIKYLGGAALVIALVAIGLERERARAVRFRMAAIAIGVALAVFVGFVPGAIFSPHNFWVGVKEQFLHQANGHLGYDSSSPAIGFHLTQALPGSVGWALAVVLLAALLVAAANGSRVQRLCALYIAVTLGALGSSHVLFPHYILVVLPVLTSLGFATLWRFLPESLGVQAVAVGLVLAALVLTTNADLRLVATSRDADTRDLATPIVASLQGRVVVENYTGAATNVQNVGAIALDPAALGCHCYVVISSYMEDRYRREPARYAKEVAIYDQLQAAATVVTVISPSVPLSYRWDLLPQWGTDRLSLGRQVVGPKITIFKLP